MKKKLFCMCFLMMILCTLNVYAKDKLYISSPSGEVSLKLSPVESSREIVKIPACSSVELVETQKTWGKVIFEKRCGWINLSFTEESYKQAANSTGEGYKKNVKVKKDVKSINLYNLPSENQVLGSKEKYSVPGDTILNVTRKTPSGWGLVDMNGKLAWARLEDTEPHSNNKKEEKGEYVISYTYVLSKGGTGLEIFDTSERVNKIGLIPDCVKLTVREKENDSYYISYNGINGWIDSLCTTDSVENAANNAGVEVNQEFEVTGAEEIDVMSVPSEFSYDGSFSEGKLEQGEIIYVLRQTASGWSYVSHGGVKGWVKPGFLTPSVSEDADKFNLSDPYTLYASPKGDNLPIYTMNDKKKKFASFPVGVSFNVVTESNGCAYVENDYGAGWVDIFETSKTYEEAISKYKNEKSHFYIITKETSLYTLPTYSELCKTEEIMTLNKGDEFTLLRSAKTGERKWALAKIGENTGWVNLNCAKKLAVPFKVIIPVVAGVIIILVIILIYWRKRKCSQSTK